MITTLTLNPAFDIHAALTDFRAGHENLAEKVTRDIGGKGINISRALTENHLPNRALVVLGSENAAEFREGLIREGLDFDELVYPGRIRENITIHPSSGDETRLSFKGFACDSGLLDRVDSLLATVAKEGDIVTFTGSLPGGISESDAEKFLISLRCRGVRVVIDSKSIRLDSLKRIKPWLIKPNAEELEAYFGELDEDMMVEKAKELHSGGIGNVIISLGGDGALLVSDEGVFRAKPPKIDAVSTIGAGDSMIAGFIAAASLGINGGEALRLASAYGTAACLREGTNPPKSTDILSVKSKTNIEKLT